MLNLLRSDFYKLFRLKSFYICGIIATILGAFDVWFLNHNVNSELGIDASVLGYNGIYASVMCLGEVVLLLSIFIAMFIPSEFSYGTIKNIASRGISRFNIYVSKLIVCAFVTVVYSLTVGIVGFTTGSIMWGVGDFSGEIAFNMFKSIGLFLLAVFAMECINIMVGFLLRHTGGTVATVLAISTLVPTLILIAEFFLKSKFDKEIELSKYWVGQYYGMAKLDVANDVLQTGIIVSLVYIFVSSAIGIYSFYKRDVK